MSSIPLPELPVAGSESGTLAETTDAAAALAAADATSADGGPPRAGAELEELDLFGSDIELDTGAPADTDPGTAAAAPEAAAASAAAAAAAAAPQPGLEQQDFDEDVDDKDLFGSDDDDIDEAELFGDVDDDESGQKPSQAASQALAVPQQQPQPLSQDGQGPPAAPTPSEVFSEMDEREIFGDVSEDEEPEKEGSVILLRRPAPTKDRPIRTLRLPNVLSIEKNAFNPRSLGHELVEGYREGENTQGHQVVQLLTPENCIRWRFKKGPDGQIMTDEDGRPQYESNGRIVEWEDGSRTLYVGGEVFLISEIEDKVILFEENSQDVHVCHGVMQHRLVATPRALETETHERLKRSQYRKYEPTRRTLLMSAEEQADAQQLLQLEAEQKKRQEKQLKRQRKETQKREAKAAAAAGAAGAITKDFLEDDGGDGVGPSIKDVKRGRTA